MSTTAPKRTALHFGLAGHPTDPSQTNEIVQSLVNAGAEKARAAGWNVQLTFFDLKTQKFEDVFEELRRELETGKWEVLIVGGGLKMAPPLVREFERVVNLWGECKKDGKVGRVVFQGAPGDIGEVLERV